MARELTRPVERVVVKLSRAPAVANPGPVDYPAPVQVDWLLALAVNQVLAPDLASAKLQVNLARVVAGGAHAWLWRDWIGTDDWVEIRSLDGDTTWFAGFVVDVDAGWTARGEHVTVTCLSEAVRAKRDLFVHGRYMKAKGGTVTHYSGLPCHFNAGGLPNRCPAGDFEDLGGLSPARGVAWFLSDGHHGAAYWTIGDILDYLAWRYNAGQTWLANAVLSETDYARATFPVVAVEGLGLWDALATAADADGYDLFETFAPAGTQARLVHRGSGSEASLKRLGAGADRVRPPMDLAEMNVFDASLAETVAPTITRPVVAGGRTLIEIGIELGQAWDATRLYLDAGETADPDDADKESGYHQRYVAGGGNFPTYADVGRLWDANTDGLYSGTPPALPVPDVGALAGAGAGAWPEIPYAPLPPITATGAGTGSIENHEPLAEVSFDEGGTWHPLPSFRCLPDRLAIYITTANLARIWKKDEAPTATENYFQALAGAYPEDVRMRLTVTVAAPERGIYQPSRRSSAGTRFWTAAWLDRGKLGQIRVVAYGSHLSGLPTDEADDSADLIAAADAVQVTWQDREIEASLAVEWPDEPLELGATVKEIAGLGDAGYSLRVNEGTPEEARYVRIVGLTRVFGLPAWGMTVQLGSLRKAALA